MCDFLNIDYLERETLNFGTILMIEAPMGVRIDWSLREWVPLLDPLVLFKYQMGTSKLELVSYL